MSRDICVCQDFLAPEHRAQIEAAAASVGMTPHFFTESQFEEARACLQNCEVLYCQFPRLVREAPATLKWFCSSSAGVDYYCTDPTVFKNPDCMLTNSNCYGVTISEHLIMVTLMLFRRMPEYQAFVRAQDWGHPLPVRSIRGGEFTILGTGDIGTSYARHLRAMGASKITGLNRSGKAKDPVYDEVVPISDLDKVLPGTQVLMMALPSTPETVGILSRERIALLPKDAYVLNVGRGTAVDQNALVEALNSEAIAGAAIDVTVPEPLPADHPLWTAKNLILTPHISGNMTLGYTRDTNVDMFCADLKNYADGKPLKNLVDRKRGY